MGNQKTAFAMFSRRCFAFEELPGNRFIDTLRQQVLFFKNVQDDKFDKTLGYKTDLKALEFHQDIEDSPTTFSHAADSTLLLEELKTPSEHERS